MIRQVAAPRRSSRARKTSDPPPSRPLVKLLRDGLQQARNRGAAITQGQLARDARVSEGYVSRILSGTRHASLRVAHALGRALGISEEDVNQAWTSDRDTCAPHVRARAGKNGQGGRAESFALVCTAVRMALEADSAHQIDDAFASVPEEEFRKRARQVVKTMAQVPGGEWPMGSYARCVAALCEILRVFGRLKDHEGLLILDQLLPLFLRERDD